MFSSVLEEKYWPDVGSNYHLSHKGHRVELVEVVCSAAWRFGWQEWLVAWLLIYWLSM
jgi:hypothetical protein